MTWEPRPVPDVNPETEPFWERTAEGVLTLCECDECGLVFHYPRAHCPECFSERVESIDAAGTGEVYTHTTMESVPGWPDTAQPVTLAVVELDEGVRLLTNIVDSDPADVHVGAPVEVVFQETEENLAVPTFRLQP